MCIYFRICIHHSVNSLHCWSLGGGCRNRRKLASIKRCTYKKVRCHARTSLLCLTGVDRSCLLSTVWLLSSCKTAWIFLNGENFTVFFAKHPFPINSQNPWHKCEKLDAEHALRGARGNKTWKWRDLREVIIFQLWEPTANARFQHLFGGYEERKERSKRAVCGACQRDLSPGVVYTVLACCNYA